MALSHNVHFFDSDLHMIEYEEIRARDIIMGDIVEIEVGTDEADQTLVPVRIIDIFEDRHSVMAQLIFTSHSGHGMFVPTGRSAFVLHHNALVGRVWRTETNPVPENERNTDEV